MKIAVELSADEAELLASTAVRLGVQPEELARATLTDALSQDKDDFRKAAEYVLEKNRSLYHRLASTHMRFLTQDEYKQVKRWNRTLGKTGKHWYVLAYRRIGAMFARTVILRFRVLKLDSSRNTVLSICGSASRPKPMPNWIPSYRHQKTATK